LKPHPNTLLTSELITAFKEIFFEFNTITPTEANLELLKAIPLEILLSLSLEVFYFGPLTGSAYLLPRTHVYFIGSGSLKERIIAKSNYEAFLQHNDLQMY